MSGFAAIFDRAPANQARDPGDLSGWLALMRARVILGDMDGGWAAYETALAQFTGDDGAMIVLEAARPMLPPRETQAEAQP